jgi:hypothetical protein
MRHHATGTVRVVGLDGLQRRLHARPSALDGPRASRAVTNTVWMGGMATGCRRWSAPGHERSDVELHVRERQRARVGPGNPLRQPGQLADQAEVPSAPANAPARSDAAPRHRFLQNLRWWFGVAFRVSTVRNRAPRDGVITKTSALRNVNSR